MKDIFQEKGFSVTSALTACRATELMNAEQFDVGFIDIKLPDGDGLSLLHKFKEHYPVGVCIIITGYASLQDAIVAMKDGADGFFTKPLNIDEVLLSIQSAFEKGRMQREIRESEARYRITTENSSDLIWIVRRDGLVEYVNATALQKTLGFKTDDVIGNSLQDLVLIDDRQRMTQLLSNIETIGRGDLELRLIDKTKKLDLWFDITGQRFTGKEGSAKIILTCHEMTARKKYEALLEMENARLQDLTQMQNDFVSNATHELRTPLTLISGAIDFVRENDTDALPKNFLPMIETIARGTLRLKTLIESLVDFSDASADSLELHLQSEDLVAVVNRSLNDSKSQMVHSKVEIILDIPERLIFNFDPARVYQTIKHLIVNAIKNSHDDGIIRISVKVQDTMVVISVHDNGIGFTDEEKNAIFKKFGKIFRQKSDFHIDIQGFGLGLYIAKKVIEKHGGTMWMESRGRNMGSTFTFSLPANGMNTG